MLTRKYFKKADALILNTSGSLLGTGNNLMSKTMISQCNLKVRFVDSACIHKYIFLFSNRTKKEIQGEMNYIHILTSTDWSLICIVQAVITVQSVKFGGFDKNLTE